MYKTLHKKQGSVTVQLRFARSSVTFCAKRDKNCPRYCNKKVFLYPKHLKMVGRYNSLFGYDEKILWDEKKLQDYLEQGIDRIVVNVSL